MIGNEELKIRIKERWNSPITDKIYIEKDNEGRYIMGYKLEHHQSGDIRLEKAMEYLETVVSELDNDDVKRIVIDFDYELETVRLTATETWS
jgi:hypothetical protein